MWRKLLDALPHGYNMAEDDWQRRHRLLLWVLGVHVPGLVALGLALGYAPRTLVLVAAPPLAAVALGYMLRHHRRTASVTVTAGLSYSSAAIVGLTHGTIEAHFHFFIMIGFIAIYQDWAPFLFNIVFTVISHGLGSAWQQSLIFDHAAGQSNPWLWSMIHGFAVLLACFGMIFFWRITEDAQREKDTLSRRLADSEINRRQFTSDLLTNLARRNQSLLHRQLEIINQLEETERDPDALADLFALDHIATRVRRNAENLLVLSGEQAPRTWSDPVPLRDVLRAAIAETENLERVVFVVDEQSAVAGHTVTDLTHLLAELTENAVRFSPPDTTVTVRSRPDRARPGGRLISIEDWGVGMPPAQIEEANTLLALPPDIDLSVSQRLGFHVVARLAARHGIRVALSVTPGSGTTALVTLPPSLFAPLHPSAAANAAAPVAAAAASTVSLPTINATAGATRNGTTANGTTAGGTTANGTTASGTTANGTTARAMARAAQPGVPGRAAKAAPTPGSARSATVHSAAAGSATPGSATPGSATTGSATTGTATAISGATRSATTESTATRSGTAAMPNVSVAARAAGPATPSRPAAEPYPGLATGPAGAKPAGVPSRAAEAAGWNGWWDPAVASPMPAFNPARSAFGPDSAAKRRDPAGPGHSPASSGRTPTGNGSIAAGSGPDAADNAPDAAGNAPNAAGFGRASTATGSRPAPIEPGPNVLIGAVTRDTSAPSPDAGTGPPTVDAAAPNADADAVPPSRGRAVVIGASADEPPRPGPARLQPPPRPFAVAASPDSAESVPNPRTTAPVDPVSGLRRRVPQAHLSAQLRTPEPEVVDLAVHRRPAADAAAALSRYQASRAAAQAVVGDGAAATAGRTTADTANGGPA